MSFFSDLFKKFFGKKEQAQPAPLVPTTGYVAPPIAAPVVPAAPEPVVVAPVVITPALVTPVVAPVVNPGWPLVAPNPAPVANVFPQWYEGQLFDDQATLDDYKVRLQAWKEGNAHRDAQDNVPGSVNWPLFSVEEENSILGMFDQAASDELRWYHITFKERQALDSRFARTVGAAGKLAVNNLINQYNSGPAPAGYADSDLAKYRGM